LFGLCGVLWVSRFNFAQSNTASGFELTVIAASVIGGTGVNGGRGSVEGVVLGAFLLSFLINAMNVANISPFWKMAIQGLVILVAVIFDSYLVSRKRR
jgi:rhamnose transport system permease protein